MQGGFAGSALYTGPGIPGETPWDYFRPAALLDEGNQSREVIACENRQAFHGTESGVKIAGYYLFIRPLPTHSSQLDSYPV